MKVALSEKVHIWAMTRTSSFLVKKILSSELLRTVYHMDPLSCADKEESKHHSQRRFTGLWGQHAPALPPGCGRGIMQLLTAATSLSVMQLPMNVFHWWLRR